MAVVDRGERMTMRVEFELLKNEILGIRFKYDAGAVEQIRRLARRRWNRPKGRWEVPLASLPEVREIFRLAEDQVPGEVQSAWLNRWAKARLAVELKSLEGRLQGPGLSRDVLEVIDAETSFPLPGSRFSPRYRSGRWDGRRHLLSRNTLKFPRGLWPRIKTILDGAQTNYEVHEEIPPDLPRVDYGLPRSTLRPYQKQALEAALAQERGIIQIATGGGKTLLAAHLLHALESGAFFFVHTRDLLHQTADALGAELGVEVGRLGDGWIQLEDITVATVQTAARALGIRWPGKTSSDLSFEEEAPERPTSVEARREEIAGEIARAGAVIFDECHHVPADTFYKIALRTSGARRRYGLSATPWRDDGHDLLLEAALGPTLIAITCSELIQSGYLVRPRIRMLKVAAPKMAGRRNPYSEIYRWAIAENQLRNRAIAAQARCWAEEGRSVLILVSHVDHGHRLKELLPEAGFAHGALDSPTRRQLIHDLERKLRPILIATTLADEGLDIPSLDALILGGGGKSSTRAYQRVGRVLRPSEGKEKAMILDFIDAAPYLDGHSQARLALYRHEQEFEVEIGGWV